MVIRFENISIFKTNELFLSNNNSGRTDVIPVLIQNGAEVNAKNVDGETPLFCAAKGGKML